MDINDFLKKVAEQYDETEMSAFTPQTRFKELADWSSLIALSIIAMIDEDYNISLKSEDLAKSETIEDLFCRISQR